MVIGQPSAELFGGHKRIAHTGGINGFSSAIARLPDDHMTVIVLANTDVVNASLIGRDVMAIYYGQKYALPNARTVTTVDPGILDQYVGKYELRPGLIVTVTREGNGLTLQGGGQATFEVQAESESRFFSAAPAATIEFVKGPLGTVTHAVISQGGPGRNAKKIE